MLVLVGPELNLCGGVGQCAQVDGRYVTEAVRWIHEVVAGVDGAVVLEDQHPPARRRHHAQAGHLAGPGPKGLAEELDDHGTEIVAHPLVEDSAEEAPVGLRRDRPDPGARWAGTEGMCPPGRAGRGRRRAGPAPRSP